MTSLGTWLLLDLSIGLALLLGAIVTPTDPVVASTIYLTAEQRQPLPSRNAPAPRIALGTR